MRTRLGQREGEYSAMVIGLIPRLKVEKGTCIWPACLNSMAILGVPAVSRLRRGTAKCSESPRAATGERSMISSADQPVGTVSAVYDLHV